MKRFIALGLLLLSFFTLFAQDFSSEGTAFHIDGRFPNVTYMGSDDHSFYTYKVDVHKEIMITFNKGDINNLNVSTTKNLNIPIRPYAYNTFKGHCSVHLYYVHNKILIFYSLLQSGDYHIFLKILDSDFNEISTQQIGLIEETGYELRGSMEYAFSPDKKMVMLASTNYCERKKAIGTNANDAVYEKTELAWFNTDTGEKLYSKFLPVETESYRISTSDYLIDNNGNMSCLLLYYDKARQGIGPSRGVLGANTCYSKFKQEELTTNEIKLTEEDKSIRNLFGQLKNGDVIYYGITQTRCLYKCINMAKGTATVEKEYLKPSHLELENIKQVFEAEDGYYLVGEKRSGFDDPCDISVIKMDKTGEYLWDKTLPNKANYSYYGFNRNADYSNYKTIFINNTLQFILLEKKNTDPDTDDHTSVINGNEFLQYDKLLSGSNMVCYSINSNGKIGTKKVLHENDKAKGVVPYSGDIILPDGKLLLNYCGPDGMIQFVELKVK